MNLQTEVAPQVVGQTGIAGVAIALPLAAGRVDGFVDRVDHLRHMDARHMAGQLVAAAWPRTLVTRLPRRNLANSCSR